MILYVWHTFHKIVFEEGLHYFCFLFFLLKELHTAKDIIFNPTWSHCYNVTADWKVSEAVALLYWTICKINKSGEASCPLS
jgi:hypothetical protein